MVTRVNINTRISPVLISNEIKRCSVEASLAGFLHIVRRRYGVFSNPGAEMLITKTTTSQNYSLLFLVS